MPSFLYKAKKGAHEAVTGEITAQNLEEAVELIHQMGLLPVQVEEGNAHPSNTLRSKVNVRRVSLRELYSFSRQLAGLLKAGIPILRALTVLQTQTGHKHFKRVIEDISLGIKNGRPFSSCLGDYPGVFSSLFVAMVHAGEESGNLPEMLLSVAQHQRSQADIISKVRTAMAYPAFMGVIGVGTIFFILTFVMPKITALFSNVQQLPLPTVILLNLSAFLRVTWLWILVTVLAAGIGIQFWARSAAGQFTLSYFKLRIPFFGKFLLKVELARFCRTMELLLKSGIPILRSIQIAIPTVGNEIVRQILVGSQADLMAGGSFGASLQRSKLIPAVVGHLIAVGEESGNLTEALRDVSDGYEQETAETIKTFTTLLEPLMILTIGSVVGFIVFAMLLPIFQVDLFSR